MSRRERGLRALLDEGAGQGRGGAFARDLLVAHFHADHRETFARARHRLGASTSDGEVFQAVEGAVRLIFRGVGADFANPNRDELRCVAQVLARKAVAWGTPPHAAEGQFHRMLDAIDRAFRPILPGAPPVGARAEISR